MAVFYLLIPSPLLALGTNQKAMFLRQTQIYNNEVDN